MNQHLATIALVVRDYDEAITFFTEKLDFDLVEDSPLDDNKRWVVVRPRGKGGASLLLARASTEEQAVHVGNQTGRRVFLFLETDDFERDYRRMREQGIVFLEEPREESYGTVVQFEDLYGNRWDFLQRRS